MNDKKYEVIKIKCNMCNEKLMLLISDSEEVECFKCKNKMKIKECETWNFKTTNNEIKSKQKR